MRRVSRLLERALVFTFLAHGLAMLGMLALLLPLTRAIPGVYVWMVRRRLVYWYRQLKALERKLDHGGAKFDAEAMQAEFDRIAAEAVSDAALGERGAEDLVLEEADEDANKARAAAKKSQKIEALADEIETGGTSRVLRSRLDKAEANLAALDATAPPADVVRLVPKALERAEARYREWYQVRYHRPQDDVTQPMDFQAAGDFNRLVYELVETVADAPERPAWTPGSRYAPKP